MFGTKTRFSFSFACKMICYSRTSHQTIKTFLEGFAWRQAIVLLFLIQKLVLRIWTKNSFSITTSKNIFFPFTCIYFWWVKDTLYAALSHLSHEIIWIVSFVYSYMKYLANYAFGFIQFISNLSTLYLYFLYNLFKSLIFMCCSH